MGVFQTTNSENQEGVKLEVSDNHLTATLKIADYSLPTPELLQQIKNLLMKNKINHGVDFPALKNVLLKKSVEPFVIARGDAPQPPAPARFEKLIEFEPVLRRGESENGRVDHKHLIRSNLVQPGTPLIRIIPGEKGKVGKDICGRVIEPPESENVLPVSLGDNVKFSDEDPRVVVAACAGLACLSPANEVRVQTTMIIEKNVDYDSGSIDFHGDVIVKGDVKSGFEVIATGNVEVHGTVEDAEIRAGGDILVDHGFTGTMKGVLKAGNDIKIGFGHNQKMEAGRDVEFEVELVGCEVKAGRTLRSSRGRVVGGQNEAVQNVIIRLAGSEEEVSTLLAAGKKSTVNTLRSDIEKRIEDCHAQMEETKNAIQEYVLKKIDKKLTESEQQELDSLQKNREILTQKLQELNQQSANLNQKIEELKRATIQVNGVMFPNVRVQIGSSTWINKEKRRFLLLREAEDRIAVSRA
ncbi:MAG: FapA family protein [Calditrichia bacterium]